MTCHEIQSIVVCIKLHFPLHVLNISTSKSCYLSNREENGLLYGYDSNYRLDRHIIQALLPQNCPVLAGKPKLIFVQACQGSETDDGAMVAAKSIAKGMYPLWTVLKYSF